MILREMSGQNPKALALSLEMGLEALLEGEDTRVTCRAKYHHQRVSTAHLDPLTDRQGR